MSTPEILAAFLFVVSVAVAVNVALFPRRRGLVDDRRLDEKAWQPFAYGRGLQFVVVGRGHPKMYGAWSGVTVTIEAEWTSMHEHASTPWPVGLGRSRNHQVPVTTRFRMPLRGMPAGLEVRRQRLFDGIADQLVRGDGEILLGDEAVDRQWLIHGDDVDAIGRALEPDPVKAALGRLAHEKGDVTIDATCIEVHCPAYVTDPIELARVLDKMHAFVVAVSAAVGVPAGLPDDVPAPDAPGPAPARSGASGGAPAARAPHRRSLGSLLGSAVSAGFTSTQVGRELVAELPGQACSVEIDVERVAPYVSRLGVQDGVSLTGPLVGGTCRVEVHVTGKAAVETGAFTPGQRVRALGYVDVYDPLRDRAEVTADLPPTILKSPTPAGSGARLRKKTSGGDVPVDDLVERARTGDLADVLVALSTGRAAREPLLLEVTGKRYPFELAVDKVAKTPAWRVDAVLRDGRTVVGRHGGCVVEVRFPPERNAELDAMPAGRILPVRGTLVSWEEVAAHAVLEARPETEDR